MFRDLITSEQELRALMGEPGEPAVKKETSFLNEQSRTFVARSPFVLLATASKDGRCDVSPKGDAPGFVQVLDDRHLVIPDRPGNKRFDGFRNILETGQIGLIFLVPGREETLRVNGRAWITRDPELLVAMRFQDKDPWFGIGVEVDQCFMHCAKAFKRSQLWEPDSWPDLATVPTGAQLIKAALASDEPLAAIQARLDEGYRLRMY
jgi:PPOX class probable FMN-dependent enzyme